VQIHFLQPSLIIFTKGANNSLYVYIKSFLIEQFVITASIRLETYISETHLYLF